SDPRIGFRLGAPRDGVVLTDFVAVPDDEIAALSCESPVERIGSECSARRDLVAIPESGPLLYEDVRLQQAFAADRHISLDYAIFSNPGSRTDVCLGVDASGWSNIRGGINCHIYMLSMGDARSNGCRTCCHLRRRDRGKRRAGHYGRERTRKCK